MKHKSKEFDALIERAAQLGCRVNWVNNVTVKIYPPDITKPFYTAHAGSGGIHPVRRFLKNKCGFAV